jgi:hypothetical protein
MRQNSKCVVLAAGTATATTITASVDTKGFSFARIMCLGSTTAAVHTAATNNAIAHNDDNSTNWTTIDALTAGTAYEVSASTVATSVAKVLYDVDLRGKKRYLKVTFSTAAGSIPTIVADLSMPSDGCGDATSSGAAHLGQG